MEMVKVMTTITASLVSIRNRVNRHCNILIFSLQERHNGVSNQRFLDCLLNRLFRHRSKKTSKLRVTGLCEGNPPVASPHKGPVTRSMFPFYDVIMPGTYTGRERGHPYTAGQIMS